MAKETKDVSPSTEAALGEDNAPSTVLDRDKKLIANYYQRFQKSESNLSEKRKMWATIDQFDRGEQWKDAVIPPWVPKPMTNLIRYIRTVKRANLASALPKCQFVSLYEEDEPTIRNIENAYNHVWEWNHVPRTLRRCVDRSLLHGTSIAYVYEDTNYVEGKYHGKSDPKNKMYQGNICVERWSQTNFFPDPDAYRLEDMKYIHTTSPAVPLSSIKNNPTYVEFVEKRYGKQQATILWDTLKGDSSDQDNQATGAIYARDYKIGQAAPSTAGDEMCTVYCQFERFMIAKGKWQLDISYYLKNGNFFLYRKENAQPNVYPFAVLYDEEEDQDFWGTSTAMDMLENQKVINKTAQTSSIISTMQQNPQKVVSKASGINGQELARTGTLAGKVWTSNDDPTKSIHIVQTPDIPKGVFETEDRMKMDIKEMNGINEAYTGQSVGSLTTSTGVNSLIDRATVRDKDKMLQIDAFVEDVSYLITLFIVHKFQDKRPLAIPQTDGTTKYHTYEPVKEVENLQWLMRCDTYASAPMTQALRKQQADNWMNMQGQFNFSPAIITPQEWIVCQGNPDQNKIMARMKKDAEIIAAQQKSNPPKIAPNGEITFTMTTKDQNIIAETMGDMMQQAAAQQAEVTALMESHVQNGVNVAPQQAQAPSAAGGAAPANAMGSQAATQNMNRG